MIPAQHPYQPRARTERGRVAGGIPRAAWKNLRGVVLQDEHRRLARHARHTPVDEFVRNHIADDGHTAARKRVKELQQPRLALALAGQRMNGSRYLHNDRSGARGKG